MNILNELKHFGKEKVLNFVYDLIKKEDALGSMEIDFVDKIKKLNLPENHIVCIAFKVIPCKTGEQIVSKIVEVNDETVIREIAIDDKNKIVFSPKNEIANLLKNNISK